MKKVLLAALALLLILPTFACDSGGGGGGEAQTTAGGVIASRTSAVDNKWVNANGRSVPYDLFGLSNVSAGRGRALPEGFKVVVVRRPAHGTLSKANTFYTPTPGYAGQDSFIFKLADAAGTVHPQKYTLTFKQVDAEPPILSSIGARVTTGVGSEIFYKITVESPGGATMTINSSSLTDPAGPPHPVLDGTQRVNSSLANHYTFNFYGSFGGTTLSWVFDVTATFTDPAGNTLQVVDHSTWP